MKKFYVLMALMFVMCINATAQIVTTNPPIIQETTPNVVLTYHADSPLGNNGLAGLPATTPIYAHIGVITNKSNGEWSHVLTPWPQSDGSNAQQANTPQNTLTYVSANTYKMNLGSLRSYFNITDPDEHIQRVCLVFRNANGSKEGKTKTGGDIFLDVMESGFAMSLTCDAASTLLDKPTTIGFTVNATEAANLSLSIGSTTFASVNNAKVLTSQYTFNQTGSYEVVATAVYGGQTYTESINVAYPKASESATYPGGTPKMGPVKNSDGTVTFCIAAPGKKSVVLVPSWDNYEILDKNTLKYQDYQGNRYFWITVSGLKDDVYYPYYFIVDSQYRVADPYAQLVLDCYSDKWLDPAVWPDMPKYPYDLFSDIMLAVYRGDINSTYKFSPFTIPDHKSLVVYELLFRDFTGTVGEANGNGTVRQAIAKIPYIKSMGFNAVELMPIMEFNGNLSWGYNTNFYFAPDKAYGSPKDYRDFIEECHKQGIAVILDIVFNQSDGLHPWYQMYPIANNPFYNQYAPHSYSVLNDWNQGNALVQQQWTDCLKYWLVNYNVDGFRFDLVKGLGDNDSYAAAGGTDNYNASRIARMKRLYDVIKSVKPDGIHINEDLAGDREEKELGEAGMLQWANINHNSCQYTMGWNEEGSPRLTGFLSTLNGGRPWGSTVSYAESHDEERMAYKNNTYGQSGIKSNNGPTTASYNRLGSLAAQMLMTPGPKMVWMFGELGADQTTKHQDGGNNTDNKIVIWNWLDKPDAKALKDIYAELINTRMSNPELFTQNATFETKNLGAAYVQGSTMNPTSPATPRTMRLVAGDKELLVLINPVPGGAPMRVSVSGSTLNANNSKLIVASKGTNPKLSVSGGTVGASINANCFAVFASQTVTGIEDVPVSGVNASDVNIYGGTGEIIIEGEYTSAAAYTADGRRTAGLTGLTPGLYIVRVDGQATKVVVK